MKKRYIVVSILFILVISYALILGTRNSASKLQGTWFAKLGVLVFTFDFNEENKCKISIPYAEYSETVDYTIEENKIAFKVVRNKTANTLNVILGGLTTKENIIRINDNEYKYSIPIKYKDRNNFVVTKDTEKYIFTRLIKK